MKRAAKFQEGGRVRLTEEQLRRRQEREQAAQEFIDNLRRLSGSGNERIPFGRGSRRPPVAPPAATPVAPPAATENQPLRSGPLTAEEEARMNEPPRPARRGYNSVNELPDLPPPPYEATPRPRPARRPAPRSRMSEADRLNQMELDRIEQDRIDEARRGLREDADRRANQGFFERMGIRRTNETGEGAPSTGSLRGDLQALGRSLGFKKGGAIKGKGMHMMPDGSMMKNKDHAAMKKGGKAMMYREGGKVRQGMQSPKAQEARAEMAEDVMRRERAREPISDKERKAGRAEAAMDSGPLTDAEKERMRASGFKKGGMVKPMKYQEGGSVEETAPSRRSNRSLLEQTAEAVRRNPILGPIARGAGALRRATRPKKAEELERRSRRGAPSDIESGPQDPFTPPPGRYLNPNQEEEIMNIKKGGMVKAKAPAKKMKSGGKVAPKKMMKGGMTSKPKKMMGGGRAMYAKGGMAKGKC